MSYKKDKKFSAEDFASYESIDDLFVKNEGDNYYIRNINQNDADGYTPLCAAILNNADPLMLMYLMDVRVVTDPNSYKDIPYPQIDFENCRPKELREGNPKRAKTTKVCDKGMSPIQIAIMAGNTNAIKALLGDYNVTVVAQEKKSLRSYSYFKDIIKYENYLPVYAIDEDGNETDQYEYVKIKVATKHDAADANEQVVVKPTITGRDILNAASMPKADILNAIADTYDEHVPSSARYDYWGYSEDNLKDDLDHANSPMLLAVKAQCYDSVKRIIQGLTCTEYNNALCSTDNSPGNDIKSIVVDAVNQKVTINDADEWPVKVIKDNKDVGLEKVLAPYCLILDGDISDTDDSEWHAEETTDYKFLETAFKWGDEDYIADFLISRFVNSTDDDNIFNWSSDDTSDPPGILLYKYFTFGSEDGAPKKSLLELINDNVDIDELYEKVIKKPFNNCTIGVFDKYFTKISVADIPSEDEGAQKPLYSLINRLYEDGTLAKNGNEFIDSVCNIVNKEGDEFDYIKPLPDDFHREVGVLKVVDSTSESLKTDYLYLIDFVDSQYNETTKFNSWIDPSIAPLDDITSAMYGDNYDKFENVIVYNINERDKRITYEPNMFSLYNESGTIKSSFAFNDESEVHPFSTGNANLAIFKDSFGVAKFSLHESAYSLDPSTHTIVWNPDSLLYKLLEGKKCYTDVDLPAGISFNLNDESITEGNATTCEFRLTSKPRSDVTLEITADEPTRIGISPSTLTFTKTNWNIPIPVTLSATDNFIDDDNVNTTITAVASSSDKRYHGVTSVPFIVNVIDNDVAGIVYYSSTSTVTEAGATVQLLCKLNSEPISDVTLNISSNKPDRLGISLSTLTFTSSNWNTPQPVILSATNDAIVNGDVTATVTLSTSSEGDTIYNELQSVTLPITIIDNDVAGIEYPTTDLTVTEGGDSVTRAFKLKSQPTSDVTLHLSAGTYAERLNISPSQLTFTSSNWNEPKQVTFAAVDDAVVNGVTTSIINIVVSSSDTVYRNIQTTSFNVIVNDNDTAGLVYVSSPITITEGGQVIRAFTLKSEPKFSVRVNFTYEHGDRFTVTPSYITFTKSNWYVEHTVTFKAVDNDIVDGDITTPVNILSVSDDSDYDVITGVITVTVNDNDSAVESIGTLICATGSVPVVFVDNNDICQGQYRLRKTVVIKDVWDSCYRSGYDIPVIPKSPHWTTTNKVFDYDLLYSDNSDN